MGSELKDRTKAFAIRIIKLTAALEDKDTTARILSKQLLRSGTSVGAHYRESQRARSKKEMISKLEGGQQELDETQYWLELLIESKTLKKEKLELLYDESNQIMAMLVASIRTLKRNQSEESAVK